MRTFYTKSLRVATYLRYVAGLKETYADNNITDKNPDGLTIFYYNDGDAAREIMKNYDTADDFHRLFNAYYDVVEVTHKAKDKSKCKFNKLVERS